MPPIQLLIKPASGLCNLRCEYCFYHDITEKRQQSSYGFMSEATLEEIIKKTLAYAENSCTIAFQGGEPTLIGLSFYKRLIEFQKQYNTKNLSIYNVIQTNGYQLNREWAEFFHDNQFLVGISLDGTIHTHDLYRKSSDNRGTFQEIMNTIELFEQYKVEYNILTVVNKKTASSVKKIYQFYKKKNFQYLQFIPCLDPFDKPSGSMPYSLTPESYGSFLCELFDLWYDDFQSGRVISIRHFDNYLSIILNNRAESCDMNGFCSIQNVIEADGEVYPCDFYVLDEYKLGNLTRTDFEQINQKRAEIGFIERSLEKDEECKACRYYPICRGGCTRHRNMSGSFTERNYFCKAYQIFFDHCLDRLFQIAQIISSPK